MKAIILSVGFAVGLCAQEPPEAAAKHMAEIKAQIGLMGQTGPGVMGQGMMGQGMMGQGMMGQTLEFVSGQLLGGDPVKGAPYSAEAVTQTTQTLADGSHILNSSSSMIYRDSEGRERREESIGKLGPMSAEGTPVRAVFISDPVAKASYTLDAATHTAHKIATSIGIGSGEGGGIGMGVTAVKSGTRVSVNRTFSASTGASTAAAGGGQVVYYEARALSNGEKSPEKVEKLGTQMVEGVQAEGTRTTVTIPAGQIGNERDINIVSERWYSQELHVLVMSKHSDPRMGETVYKLTNVNRTEPLHSMFEVPPDYKISEPHMIKVQAPQGKEDQNQDQQQN